MEIDVGTPPTTTPEDSFSLEEVIVNFHNYSSLPNGFGQSTSSSVFRFQDKDWKLRIYPGGTDWSENDNFAVALNCNLRGHVPSYGDITIPTINQHFSQFYKTRDGRRLQLRGNCESFFIENALRNDTLTIHVRIAVEHKNRDNGWTGHVNRMCTHIGQLFNDSTDSDLRVLMGGKVLHAHRNILRTRLPEFMACFNGQDELKLDEDPVLVEALLRFAYTDQPPQPAVTNSPFQLLELSNKYGCWQLKLICEQEIVEHHVDKTPKSAISAILFADAMTCPLLRVVALETLAKIPYETIEASDEWASLESVSLVKEVMATALKPNKNKRRSVSALYQRLDEQSLDLDGTLAMLEAKLDSETEPCNKRARAE